MADLIHSVLYPFANRKNIMKTVILALINFLWFLLLPMLFVNGYYVKIVRNTIKGDEDMPEWPGMKIMDWLNLLKQGFFFTLIMLIYFAVPIVISYFATLKTLSLLLLLAGFVAFILVSVLLPAALAMYSATESFFQAFNIVEIISVIWKNKVNYAVVYFIFLLLSVAVLSIGSYLPYLSGILMVIPWIFAMHGFAQILAKAQ